MDNTQILPVACQNEQPCVSPYFIIVTATNWSLSPYLYLVSGQSWRQTAAPRQLTPRYFKSVSENRLSSWRIQQTIDFYERY